MGTTVPQHDQDSAATSIIDQLMRSDTWLLNDSEVAPLLGVGRGWVRDHADEIPGYRPLGRYYRFARGPLFDWMGGEKLLLPSEAAKLLRVPKSWVYANADQIPGVLRLGGYVRFRSCDLLRFVSGSEVVQ
jgi:predicted DNA-binding transcriptional regulator AlpA